MFGARRRDLTQLKGDATKLANQATGHWARIQRKHPAVRHTAMAWRRMGEERASQFAAAITYFSFLALFPLTLLAVAVAGFVLHSHPATLQSLFENISNNVPGQLGQTLHKSIQTAIDDRASVGVVGLAGVLLTGLGWIANLRAAVEAVWGREPSDRNFIVAKLLNLLVLAGLGVGIVISLGLTVAGTSLTDQILTALSLDHVYGIHALVRVAGVSLGLVGDVIIFYWMLVRLPGVEVPDRVGLQGAVMAAMGFEGLKLAGTFTIAHSTASPTAGPFASVVAVLIWIQLVSRYMLFCAAWMAVVTQERADRAAALALAARSAEASAESEVHVSYTSRDLTLLALGAAVGASVANWRRARQR